MDSQLKRVMIAGTHSGVGKTTVTLGIMSILCERGYKVQGFKSGPDYIDISHHASVTGNISRNLDTWMMDENSCMELFCRSASKAEISIIEGVMGLYDGSLNDDVKGSSAYLANILNTPIILVVDVKGMAHSAGAVALGFKEYDKNVQIKGIILNRVGSERQFNTIRITIERSAQIPVLGYLLRNNDFLIPERHLGLVPSCEVQVVKKTYSEIGNSAKKTLDIDKVIEIAACAENFPEFENNLFPNSGTNKQVCPCHPIGPQSAIPDPQSPLPPFVKGRPGEIFNPRSPIPPSPLCKGVARGDFQSAIRIAVAMDKAFHFYYQDNLEILEALGARLCYFSPLHDKELPSGINGIYIGGGFPELFGHDLEANEHIRYAIREASKKGVLIYAECGGMMYLLDKLVDRKGESYIMCGIFSAISKMENKRQGLGYIKVDGYADNILCNKGDRFRAHEFHWSSLIEMEGRENLSFAYKVSKGQNCKTRYDGLFSRNVLASYAHVHFASNPLLAIKFLKSMRRSCQNVKEI